MVVIKRLLTDKFWRNSAIVFAGSLVAAVFNYLYHPILGRLLSVEDFGEVQTLLALFSNSVVFLGIFSSIIVNLVANHEDGQDQDWPTRVRVLSSLQSLALLLAGAGALLLLLLQQPLRDFFRFHSVVPFVVLAMIMVLSVPVAFRKGYLRGRHQFALLSWAEILLAAGRVFFAALLVWLGARAAGAMAGIVLAQLVSLAFVYWFTRDGLKLGWGDFKLDQHLRRELWYGVQIVATTLCMTVFSSADVLLVKHYFDPQTAGLYSGVATIARIVWFIAGPVTLVLLPSVKLRQTPQENQRLLGKGVAGIGLLSVAAWLVFVMAPDFVIKILIGSRYVSASPWLPLMGALMIAVALVDLLFAYYIALRQSFVVWIGLAGVAIALGLSIFAHQTPTTILYNFALAIGVIIALFIARWLKIAYQLFACRN